MSSDNEPARMRDLLGRFGQRLRGGDPVIVGRIWSSWTELVGDQIASHAAPTSLRDGILRVRVDSPVWATELHFLSADIKNKVNELVGRPAIEEVRVWTGTGEFTPLGARSTGAQGGGNKRRGKRPRKPGKAFGDPTSSDGGRAAFERAFAAWRNKRTKGSS